MRKFARAAVLAALGALAALAFAIAAIGAPAATTITVTAGKPSEFAFTLSKKTAAKGAVAFRVTNKGKIPHDFKVAGRKTKLLGAGKTALLSVTFRKAGRYPYLCTVPGHAAGGMKGIFVVK